MERLEEVRMQNVLVMQGHGRPVGAIHLLSAARTAIIDRVSGRSVW